MSKSVLFFVAIALAFALGIFSYATWQSNRSQDRSQTEATVLIERIEDVLKLVTVEGSVSEIYNETKTREVTLYLPLPTTFKFDKKAIVQVTG